MREGEREREKAREGYFEGKLDFVAVKTSRERKLMKWRKSSRIIQCFKGRWHERFATAIFHFSAIFHSSAIS